MIIDDSACLQMRVNCDRTHVLHPTFLQVFAHPVGQTVPGRDFSSLVSGIEVRLSICKAPYIFTERTVLVPYFLETPGIMYDRFDLSPRPDHPFRVHNPLNVFFPVFYHFIKVKLIKTFPEDLAFLYHHVPVQSALHDLHHQKLKLLLIIVERHAPLLIMIADHFIVTCAPGTSVHRITSLSRISLNLTVPPQPSA